MPVAEFLNVQEAADTIGCTTGRVRQMLITGEMRGIKANGRAWLITKAEVAKIANTRHKTGRPRKSS